MPEHRELQVDFNANPVQRQFIYSEAKADLYAGRRGEGKSTALSWSCFRHTRRNPGAHWVFIRDTFENLTKTTQKTFFEWFPPGIAGHYHKTAKEFEWAEGLARGRVTWIGMDNPEDASRLLSLEMAGFAMDEAAPAATSGGIDEMVFDLAMTSLRQPGIKAYLAKVAENNPDESHWTYQKFVDPGTPGYLAWQPDVPENEHNLREGYYADMRVALRNRPDLVRRLVDGKFGFQSQGLAVTPQFSEELHLASGLVPFPRHRIYILWDWGHNPTAIFTQVAPNGQWLILDAQVGEGIGVEELIEAWVRPLWQERYAQGQHELTHVFDPAGLTGEQTSIARSPVMAVKALLGGDLRPGPVRLEERINPLQSVLGRTVSGMGLVRIDRRRAKHVWWALRGGWYYPIARTGLISTQPRKNEHSHPGDAMGYGAAVLYPMTHLARKGQGMRLATPSEVSYFGRPRMGQLEGALTGGRGSTISQVLRQ